jgi:hypothetical protein
MKRAGYDQLDVPGEEGGRKWNGKLVIGKKRGKKKTTSVSHNLRLLDFLSYFCPCCGHSADCSGGGMWADYSACGAFFGRLNATELDYVAEYADSSDAH